MSTILISRKRRRNKHVSATKPLSFFNLMLQLFPQTQLNQLHLSGNALEFKKKKKKIDYCGRELHFKSTEKFSSQHIHISSVTYNFGWVLSKQEEMRRRPWDRFRFKRDIWYSPFILKNSPCCPSVNRIIAPTNNQPWCKSVWVNKTLNAHEKWFCAHQHLSVPAFFAFPSVSVFV